MDSIGSKKIRENMKSAMEKFKKKAKELKRDINALYLAYKRPEVPWYAKVLAAIIVGYALSPIDLIPDFIPVLGYLDDLLLIPAGIYFVVKLIPADIMKECRLQAEEAYRNGKPKNWIAAALIIFIWIVIISLIIYRLFLK